MFFRRNLTIRGMRPADVLGALEIERQTNPPLYGEDRFSEVLRSYDEYGLVAVSGSDVLGFVVYRVLAGKFRVLNLAVRPEYRRRRIGSRLLRHLKDLLAPGWDRAHDLPESKKCIDMLINERNHECVLFLRENGFRCVLTCRDLYEDGDGWSFRYVPGQRRGVNRLGLYMGSGR